MDSILENKNDPKIKNIISRNKKNNEKIIIYIDNSKYNIIYLGKEGKIYDNKNKIISKVVIPDKKYQLYNCSFGLKRYLNMTKLEIKKKELEKKLKEFNHLPNFINKDSIEFYSIFYPKIKIPKNLISYYEYPNKDISFFKIEDKFYDDNLVKSKDKNSFINKNKSDIHRIFMFKYEKKK